MTRCPPLCGKTVLKKEEKKVKKGKRVVTLEKERVVRWCKKAKLQAGIKPTALCSVINKENLIESPLDLLHYIYNYYCGYAPCLPQSLYPSANFFVTFYDCDL